MARPVTYDICVGIGNWHSSAQCHFNGPLPNCFMVLQCSQNVHPYYPAYLQKCISPARTCKWDPFWLESCWVLLLPLPMRLTQSNKYPTYIIGCSDCTSLQPCSNNEQWDMIGDLLLASWLQEPKNSPNFSEPVQNIFASSIATQAHL